MVRFQDGDVTVYEVPGVLPRAFVAGSIDAVPDRAAVLAAMTAASLDDLRNRVFVGQADLAPLQGVPTSPEPATRPVAGSTPVTPLAPGDGTGDARIVHYESDRVDVEVHASGPGVLVLTDVMAPGWVAQRDGTTIPIATVDATFRGVAVDASTRQVVFRYQPVFTYVGFALAGIALLLVIAWSLMVRPAISSSRPARGRVAAGPDGWRQACAVGATRSQLSGVPRSMRRAARRPRISS